MKHYENYEYESKLIEQGYSLIAGTDEVGRGPLAGPVVAACVIINTISTNMCFHA